MAVRRRRGCNVMRSTILLILAVWAVTSLIVGLCLGVVGWWMTRRRERVSDRNGQRAVSRVRDDAAMPSSRPSPHVGSPGAQDRRAGAREEYSEEDGC